MDTKKGICADQVCSLQEPLLEQKEIWKTVPGFERYEVSNFGRLRKYIAGCTPNGWYTQVTLSDGIGDPVKIDMHRLVMRVFVGPAPTGCNVNHKDGNKSNPRLDNLEYVLYSENTRHAIETGLLVPHFRITDDQVDEIRELCKTKADPHVAKLFGVSYKYINAIRLGKKRKRRWTKKNE